MIEEMISTVKAALAPGADAATKQQAAGILRGLLGMLESGGPSASGVPAGSVGPAPNAQPYPAGTDLLAAIVEYVRPHLPAEAVAQMEQMPRFRVPLVNLPTVKP
jgi:hypothetical protein